MQSCWDLSRSPELYIRWRGDEASSKTFSALRRYYQTAASEYDSFLQEELSLQETQAFISVLPKIREDVVLDVACGTGRITRHLTARGRYYVGLDLSDAMLAILARKTSRENVDLVCGSALGLPFRDSGIRMVTCFGLTGYLNARQQQTLMRDLSRVVRIEGYIVVDFLRPRAEQALAMRREEQREGNKVFLLGLNGIKESILEAGFKITKRKKTPRQIQFLMRKVGGKD